MTTGTTSTNLVNQAPVLPHNRKFPTDPQGLQTALGKAYIETANCVNLRDIAIYDQTQILNGQVWFSDNATNANMKRYGQRAVFTFNDSTLTITHNISSITQVTRVYGVIYDGTYWYPLPYVDVAAANNQVGVKVSGTQIIVTKGGGSPPHDFPGNCSPGMAYYIASAISTVSSSSTRSRFLKL